MPQQFQLLLDGAQAPEEVYAALTSLEVEEHAEQPGTIEATLTIAAAGAEGAQDLTLLGNDAWQPFARLAVVVTPEGGDDACIFDGHVLGHAVHIERGGTASTVRVWGQDPTCLMNLTEELKPWTETDGQIANAIFDKYGFTAAGDNTADDSPARDEKKGHSLMQRATDAQFLRDRARKCGKLFRVACDRTAGQYTGYFVKPKLDGEPELTLTVTADDPATINVDGIDIKWDASRPTKVLAQALLTGKEAASADTDSSGLQLLESRSLAAAAGDRVIESRLTAIVDSADELKQRAASLLREAGWFVRCEGETDLTRHRKVIRAARLVEVAGAGRVHSGNYLVWSVRHIITRTDHKMHFTLVRNSMGAP